MLASRPRQRHALLWWAGLVVTVVAAAVVVRAVDVGVLARSWHAAIEDPPGAAIAGSAFAAAFVLRALAWRRVLPGLPFGHALSAIHVSLGGNHVLPARLGEVLRVTSVVRRAGVAVEAAAASTLTLRAADVAALSVLAMVLGAGVLLDLAGAWIGLVVLVAVGGLGLGIAWLRRLIAAGRIDVRLPGAGVAGLTLIAWVLEAAVMHRAAAWAGVDLGYGEAVLVTALTVAGQLLALAPGGFGTYEAVGTAALVAIGVDAGTGLAIALTAHAVKTAYALLTGAVALVVPAPGLLGRVRLPGRGGSRPRDLPAEVPAGPIVLFVPAHDERDAIAGVVARVPDRVHGREVCFLVIDDGSSDGTPEVARAAGAEVVQQPHNRGLGAAVRRGFSEALARDAAVVAFCDADGEYAPEELGRLVAPILSGQADYVIGSRFKGRIERMLPHRRLGNRVLTSALRFVARTPISDGQSGYRALSREAVRRAEVIHDFNYAQVLTLDLLAKGFRYAEVPISYRFRETGTSFVRLGRYLRAVVPAVWRELNEEPAGA
ncbi:MAG TPA: glycosyltransferase [Nitriliruptorales bacterium]